MPSSGRHILDIKKKASSRTKARAQMGQLFSRPLKRNAPPRLKARRQKQRIIVGCICLLGALGLVGGLGAASHMEQLAINDVFVSGAQAVPAEALIASASGTMRNEGFQLFSRENMFLYPRRAIENTLTVEFPRIKDVSLSRPSLLAQALIVTVEERAPYARWCGEHCFLLDSSGFIFAEAGDEAVELPYIFRGGLAPGYEPVGQWFLRGRIALVVVLVEKLQQAGFETTTLSVDSEKDFSVRLAQGPVLFMSFDMDADTIVHNLEIALEADSLRDRFHELEYVDLRFGERVYYK